MVTSSLKRKPSDNTAPYPPRARTHTPLVGRLPALRHGMAVRHAPRSRGPRRGHRRRSRRGAPSAGRRKPSLGRHRGRWQAGGTGLVLHRREAPLGGVDGRTRGLRAPLVQGMLLPNLEAPPRASPRTVPRAVPRVVPRMAAAAAALRRSALRAGRPRPAALLPGAAPFFAAAPASVEPALSRVFSVLRAAVLGAAVLGAAVL